MRSLTKEQKELTRLLGSDKLKSERLIEEVKADRRQVRRSRPSWASAAPRSPGAARCGGNVGPGRGCREQASRGGDANPSPSSAPRRAGCARSRAIRNSRRRSNTAKATAPASGSMPRPPTRSMMLATDGRFFTLDGSKLPGGRGNGEAIRSFIDLPPEADIVDHVRACAGPQAAGGRHQPAMASSPMKTTPSP